MQRYWKIYCSSKYLKLKKENPAKFLTHAKSNYLRRPIQPATIHNNVAHKTLTYQTNYLLFQHTKY